MYYVSVYLRLCLCVRVCLRACWNNGVSNFCSTILCYREFEVIKILSTPKWTAQNIRYALIETRETFQLKTIVTKTSPNGSLCSVPRQLQTNHPSRHTSKSPSQLIFKLPGRTCPIPYSTYNIMTFYLLRESLKFGNLTPTGKDISCGHCSRKICQCSSRDACQKSEI